MSDLDGRRVLVAGASAGIGREFAIRAAAVGAKVAATARRADRLADLDAVAVPGDIADPEQCRRIADEAAAALGGIDLLLSSVGSAPMQRFAGTEPEHWAQVLSVNVVGTHQLIRATLPHLSEGGVVAVLSSESVSDGRPALGAYAASKAALETSMQVWRNEHPGLRFATVQVGATMPTEFGSNFTDADLLGAAMENWTNRGLMQEQYMETGEVADVLVSMLAGVLPFPGVCIEHVRLRSPSKLLGDEWTESQ